ncbi:MAG: phosphatase PAP2 family protein [Clostridia bacterium]|nr:phosphatase PAP2 family protein [Clostridia bacterium]
MIIAALSVLTVCGSFWDYAIATALYLGQQPTDNFFGVLFAFIGVIPTFVGWSFLGASILYLSKKRDLSIAKRRWLTALSVLLFVLSFFYFCNTLFMVNESAFPVHWAIAYPIGIAVIFAAAVLGYKLSKASDNPNLLRSVLFLTLVSLVTMLIIMLTKEIMNRPRFRWVMETGNPEFFRNWWQSGKDIKDALGSGVVSDDFASFPSGHSAYAMFAIFLFPAFADYLPKWQKYRGLLFICGVVWWALTALSRLTVGAHYLTDVCIAALVTVLVYEAATWIKYGIQKKREKTKN